MNQVDEDPDDPLILYLERRSDDPFDRDEMFLRLREVLNDYSYKISISGGFQAMLKVLMGINELTEKYDDDGNRKETE